MDSNVNMGSNPHHAPPPLCAAGCGFFGTAEKGGLCSKCYTDRHKETTAMTQATTAMDDNPKENEIASTPLMAADPTAKSKCSVCREKVELYGFDCRCGLRFRGFKGVGKKTIEKQPLFCATGCGFFGTAEKGGLCSKCYTNRRKETTAMTHRI